VIRPAVPEDADAIQEIAKRAWVRAYADFIDPGLMLSRLEDAGPARFRAAIADEANALFVLEIADRVAGYVGVCPARDAAESGCGEIAVLYVDPPAQGAGAGTALLERAEAELRARGFAEALLEVFAENGHGRAFYERHGWGSDGRAVQEQGDWAPKVVYRKALAAAAGGAEG
jgi:ribosomal protein S18 acetylase RimI-like enzyme